MIPKKLLIAMALLFAMPVGTFAETSPEGIDAMRWFDGCAALTQDESGLARDMDAKCTLVAFDYCDIGRVLGDRLNCKRHLADQIKGHIQQLSMARLSSDGLSPFSADFFERKSNELKSGGAKVDCEVTDTKAASVDCVFLKATLDWVDWRLLHRMSRSVEKGKDE